MRKPTNQPVDSHKTNMSQFGSASLENELVFCHKKGASTMSSDAKANTLPKWSYILLAVLLGPFGVGLIWAIVSKGNVPDAVMMIASVCILTAIALIVHLAWPRRSMWFAHLTAFVLFFILFLCLVRRSRSLRIRHGVHEPADAGSNGQSGIQG